ncbi:MAG: hypothetical protein R3Y63_10925 [Eubacteriales bacterium]
MKKHLLKTVGLMLALSMLASCSSDDGTATRPQVATVASQIKKPLLMVVEKNPQDQKQ